MTLTIYSSTAEPNRLNKTNYITQVVSMTSGQLTEPSSVIDPVITITSTTNYFKADSAKPANYAYIPDFGRYYFIREVVSIAKDVWQISMHCDVLMSYKSQIANCTGYLRRTAQTSYADRFLVDTERAQTGGVDVTEYAIGEFDNQQLIDNDYRTYVTMLIGRT